MSDERLSLLKAGLTSAAINVLDGQKVMSAWAEMIASGRDTQPLFVLLSGVVMGGDRAVAPSGTC